MGVGVGVAVGTGVGVGAGVSVGVGVGVAVAVGMGVLVGTGVGAAVGVGVNASAGMSVDGAAAVGVGLGPSLHAARVAERRTTSKPLTMARRTPARKSPDMGTSTDLRCRNVVNGPVAVTHPTLCHLTSTCLEQSSVP